jgi:hypothetical protein
MASELQTEITMRSQLGEIADVIERAARTGPSAGNRIVDLNEITVIDKSGEEALSMMIDEGTKFVATGLYTKHLLEALRIRTVNPSD